MWRGPVERGGPRRGFEAAGDAHDAGEQAGKAELCRAAQFGDRGIGQLGKKGRVKPGLRWKQKFAGVAPVRLN